MKMTQTFTFSPDRCPGFQLLPEKAADLLEVLFPASPMLMS